VCVGIVGFIYGFAVKQVITIIMCIACFIDDRRFYHG